MKLLLLIPMLMLGCCTPNSSELARCRQDNERLASINDTLKSQNDELKSQNEALAQSLKGLVKTTNEKSKELEQSRQQPKTTPP